MTYVKIAKTKQKQFLLKMPVILGLLISLKSILNKLKSFLKRIKTNKTVKAPNYPQFVNSRIKTFELDQIKNELSPLLQKLGPWEIFLRARSKIIKSGYPTIYSVLGGPLETFAELGAYIALDPKASTYVPIETINWYKMYVLR